jgi:AcrR family transcriptional regulator
MIKPTAQTIVEAALKTLQTAGFAGATSRAIARTGGFNQALIFYHYGSLEALLLAALQRTSDERLARYREAVGGIDTLDELIPVLADLWEEDKASGHVQVVSQFVAGSLNRPELSRRIVELMEPWIELAEETVGRVFPAGLPVPELAYGVVTFYLGVNLMTHLDAEHARTDALFARARELAPLLGPLLGSLEP